MSTRPADPSGFTLYDPRGIVHVAERALAPRARRLDGLRVAVLDNTKWNGWKLLERTAALLGERTPFAAVTRYKKEGFSFDASPELIARIAAENDVVLVGIGD
jgi:hypothetical protein